MKLTYSLLLSSAFLSACTTLVPGTSKEADVMAHFGHPVEQRKLPDGGRVLEYPRSPLGYENWRVTLSADGTVRRVEQLLDEEHFRRVTPGMTIDQVKLELGRPGEFTKYANLSEEVLSWRYMEFSRRMFFNAHFDMSGRLKYASRSEEPFPMFDSDGS